MFSLTSCGSINKLINFNIYLCEILFGRWSAIAAKLPGRTDNEIKNVWHTHLKKRLHQNQDQNNNEIFVSITSEKRPTSSQQHCSSSTEVSAVTTSGSNNDISNNNKDSATSSEDVLTFIDESFWSEVVLMDCDISGDEKNEKKIENWEGSLDRNDKGYSYSKLYNDDMEFCFDLLMTSSRTVGEISDINEF